MKISIYQINFDRDYNNVAFRSLEELEKIQETSEIDSELYDRVFEGEVACDNLEEVYGMFNCSQPEGYRGRSLSISDVVEMNGKFYYCDNIGWKEIEFDSYLTGALKEDKIKVVLCEPGETAKVVEIENTLESLQKTVGGYIETFYPYEEEVCMVCNDEGKFNGMQPSRAVRVGGKILDVIYGPFIICDCRTENFGSLNDEQLKRFAEQFRTPETLIRVGGKIVCVPYGN